CHQRDEPDGKHACYARLHRSNSVDGWNAPFVFNIDGFRAFRSILGNPTWLARTHCRGTLLTRSTSLETVPVSRRSPLPVKDLLTMHAVSLPRRRINWRATRCTMRSPFATEKLTRDSDPSSFRRKTAGSSARGANVSRVWTPSSDAAVGFSSGRPQNQ